MTKKSVFVVAAIIIRDGRYLCTQRGLNSKTYISHKWEFPGGKVEAAETNREAIVREIQEELGIEISIRTEYATVQHEYPDFTITMEAFLCTWNAGEISLTEHAAYKFLKAEELEQLDWAAADIPLVQQLVLEKP
jgi:8-oxo-dGTP diphosphatase